MAFVRPKYLSKTQGDILAVFVQAAGAPLSHADIARAARCCERTVKRAMPRLVQLGYVKVRHRFLKNGGQLPNSYFVTAKGKRALMPPCSKPEQSGNSERLTAQPGP